MRIGAGLSTDPDTANATTEAAEEARSCWATPTSRSPCSSLHETMVRLPSWRRTPFGRRSSPNMPSAVSRKRWWAATEGGPRDRGDRGGGMGSRSRRRSSSTFETRSPPTRISALSSNGRRSRRPGRSVHLQREGVASVHRPGSRCVSRFEDARRPSVGGFNCAGEIGAGRREELPHGFTASVALLVDA
jgi:hypothetical protein